MRVAIFGYDIAAKVVSPGKLICSIGIGRPPVLNDMLKTAVVGWWLEVVEKYGNEG
jgi:hypothetical protein